MLKKISLSFLNAHTKHFLILLFIVFIFSFLPQNLLSQNCNIDSLLQSIDNQTHTGKVKSYLCIGNSFEYTNPDSAFFYYRKAITEAKQTDSTELLVEAYNNLSIALMDNGKYLNSLLLIDSALAITRDSTNILYLRNNLATIYINNGLYDKAFKIYDEQLKYFLRKNDTNGISTSYSNFSALYYNLKNEDSALFYNLKALEIDKKLNDSINLTFDFMNIGIDYTMTQDYEKAEEYLLKALNYAQELNIDFIIADIYSSLAYLYSVTGDKNKAIEFYNKSLSISKKFSNYATLVNTYKLLSITYLDINKYQQAKEYLDSARILAKIHSCDIQNIDRRNLLEATFQYFEKIGNTDSALYYYKKYVELKDTISFEQQKSKIKILQIESQIEKNSRLIEEYQLDTQRKNKQLTFFVIIFIVFAILLIIVAIVIIRLRKTKKELNNNNKKLKQALERDEIQLLLFRIQTQAAIDIVKKDLKHLLQDLLENILSIPWLKVLNKGIIFVKNKNNELELFASKNIGELAQKCAIIKKGECLCGKVLENFENISDNGILKKHSDAADINVAHNHYIMPIKTGDATLGVLNLYLPENYVLTETNKNILAQLNFILASAIERKRQREKIIADAKTQNELNQKLFAQSLFFEQQKIKLEKVTKQLEITLNNLQASVNYASYIVNSMLPTDEYLKMLFNDYFLIFKPAETIGGDFYFAKKLDDNRILFAVGDATGHGVSGALLATQAITFIRGILMRNENILASELLTKLRERIKKLFKYAENASIAYNGIDVSMCLLDSKNNKITFAGANMPLTIVRNNQILKFKGTKSPIGTYIVEREFKQTVIEMEENDVIYLETDGFSDQLGGNNYKKFGRKNYENLLLQINQLPLQKQHEILLEKFNSWKTDNPQIDDITVFGFKWKNLK